MHLMIDTSLQVKFFNNLKKNLVSSCFVISFTFPLLLILKLDQ